ncbi:MAG: extracellular solute-binding protein [Acidobacteria bacterium]|nr:extracellular solute-binding protein [Acidobacteriota bacterium]
MPLKTPSLKTLKTALLTALCAGLLAPSALFAQTELVIWHAYRGAEKDAFEKVVAEFNTVMKAKKVTAKTLAVPYDAYADKISAAVPRGKGPDVFIYAQDRLGGWVEAGKTVEPIDFFLDDATEKRFIPSTMDALTYQGTLYGLPVNFKVVTMIYNKKLVQKPPTTSGELVATAKKLTDAAAGRFGLAYAYTDFYYHAALMNAFGGGVFDASRQPVMNQSANVKSFELLLKWLDQDKILPAEPSVALITNLFNEGRAGIVFSGPWFLGEIKDSIDYGLAPMPKLDEAGGAPLKPWVTVEGAFIAEPSQHKDEAWEFISFLTGDRGARIMAVEGRQTVANKKIYDDPAVQKDPILQAFRKQVESAVPMPNYAEMTMMWSPATTAMNTVVKGTASPKAALDRAEEEVAERIKNLRK